MMALSRSASEAPMARQVERYGELDAYDRCERAILRALAIYHNAQTERGLMPGVARRVAVEEAMAEWEESGE